MRAVSCRDVAGKVVPGRLEVQDVAVIGNLGDPHHDPRPDHARDAGPVGIVAAGTPKNGTNTEFVAPRSMSGR